MKKCADPGCERTRAAHRWGSIKAHDAGWFELKDGTTWCPEHTPDWVAGWRARKAAQDDQ